MLRITILALSALTGLPLLAHGGGESGGGGNSVVCRRPDGTIKSAELLDLYEGRVVYDLQYAESGDAWKKQVARIMAYTDVATFPDKSIPEWARHVMNHLRVMPEGAALKPIHDSLESIIPVGCEIRQTAKYENDNLILVDREIWNALSETQKAALVAHEAIYRYLRGRGEKIRVARATSTPTSFPARKWSVLFRTHPCSRIATDRARSSR